MIYDSTKKYDSKEAQMCGGPNTASTYKVTQAQAAMSNYGRPKLKVQIAV